MEIKQSFNRVLGHSPISSYSKTQKRAISLYRMQALIFTKLLLTDLEIGFNLSSKYIKLCLPLLTGTVSHVRKGLPPSASYDTAPYIFLIINCRSSKDIYIL